MIGLLHAGYTRRYLKKYINNYFLHLPLVLMCRVVSRRVVDKLCCIMPKLSTSDTLKGHFHGKIK